MERFYTRRSLHSLLLCTIFVSFLLFHVSSCPYFFLCAPSFSCLVCCSHSIFCILLTLALFFMLFLFIPFYFLFHIYLSHCPSSACHVSLLLFVILHVLIFLFVVCLCQRAVTLEQTEIPGPLPPPLLQCLY